METACLLRGTFLLLLLSCPIHGQSQQSPHSMFLPNIFSTIQATLGSFNRFSYMARPVGPFPAAGHHPGDVNFAYAHTFLHPVPHQPVIKFTGSTRTRQNVPVPTSPPIRDEVRQQLPPKLSSNSDAGISPLKHPAPPPPLAMLPPPPDNRHFHDIRFIQPPSSVLSENNRKENPTEKFHKPVRTDSAFGSENIRNADTTLVAVPSNSDKVLVWNKTPHGSYNSATLVVNAKRYNASSHPAQPTRIIPHINKERRPFNNFKPMVTQMKTLARGKPIFPPQIVENRNRLPEVPSSDNTAKFQGEKILGRTPTREANTSAVPSASERHSIYAKPTDEMAKRPTVSEWNETHAQSKEPLSLPFPPKQDTETSTLEPGRDSDISTETVSNEFSDETLPVKVVTESPLPPQEDHLVSENISPLVTKSVISPTEVERFDETSSIGNWGLGDNKVITGTPEEILILKLADAVNNFGFGLYRRLQETNNLFFSPLSLSAALAIVLEGTSNMTALQLMNGLHFSESNIRPDEVKAGFKRLMKSLKTKRSDYQFENANLLLLQNKFFFKSEFSNTVYRYYKPLLGSVDFAENGRNIKRNVNDWVKRRTHGKIAEFLTEQLPPETVFAVLNAVYFRGQWVQPFDSTLTRPAPFYNHGKDPVEVTMMKQIGTFAVGYSAKLNAQIIELLYEGEETSMVILLPEERDGIYSLKGQLNYQELYVILSAIDFHLVQLSLPRFSLRKRYDMEDVLKDMGMKDVFTPGKGNFGRMTNATGLYLSKVAHEGVIDVDEKGTEAAASTGGFVVPLSRPRDVIVDHPFFFFIRNRNNGAILFIGQFDAFHV